MCVGLSSWAWVLSATVCVLAGNGACQVQGVRACSTAYHARTTTADSPRHFVSSRHLLNQLMTSCIIPRLLSQRRCNFAVCFTDTLRWRRVKDHRARALGDTAAGCVPGRQLGRFHTWPGSNERTWTSWELSHGYQTGDQDVMVNSVDSSREVK